MALRKWCCPAVGCIRWSARDKWVYGREGLEDCQVSRSRTSDCEGVGVAAGHRTQEAMTIVHLAIIGFNESLGKTKLEGLILL